MILCAVVIVILLSMMLFKREGFSFSQSEEEKLIGIFKKYNVLDTDQSILREAFAASPDRKSQPPGYEERINKIFSTYGSEFGIELRNLIVPPPPLPQANLALPIDGQGGAARTRVHNSEKMMMANSFIPGQGGAAVTRGSVVRGAASTMPKLPSGFGCNRTPGDSKFSCTFK